MIIKAACTAFALWACDGPAVVIGQGTALAADTVAVAVGGGPPTPVRLVGVRAPGPGVFCRGQIDGRDRECVYYARDQLAGLLSGSAIECRLRRDRGEPYALGLCKARNTGTDVGFWLVRRGLAAASNSIYADVEREARRERVGMWSTPGKN